MIINTLVLSGLWYTGSGVLLLAWAEKKINQIILDFLWSEKNEQIKREVCYLPYELGGLKVVNVALKCKALLAKSAVFIIDGQYKAKWVYLARYFIGHDLGRLHKQWGFLKSHTKPHAWSAPSYYLTVASLVQRFFHESRTQCLFKVVHYVLKTGEYFSTWNHFHICLDCSFCPGQLETLKHLFLDCVFAREVWHWASPLFCKLLGSPNFVPASQTLLGLDFVEGFPMTTQRLAMYFLKLILYAIWHFRKMKRFEKCYLAC